MYHLFTDGSVIQKQGGWAFILQGPNGEINKNGCESDCGTNKMELMAVIQGLKQIEQPSIVYVYTDSYFVINGVRAPIKPHKAISVLWLELKAACAIHEVSFIKVGTSNPHPTHKKAHNLAREAILTKGINVNSKVCEVC